MQRLLPWDAKSLIYPENSLCAWAEEGVFEALVIAVPAGRKLIMFTTV